MKLERRLVTSRSNWRSSSDDSIVADRFLGDRKEATGSVRVQTETCADGTHIGAPKTRPPWAPVTAEARGAWFDHDDDGLDSKPEPIAEISWW